MIIRLTRRQGRNRLACYRPDGSSTSADTGPGLPHHDLAHFVVETEFAMTSGFFGQIAAGRSVQELSDPDHIRQHGFATMPAEVMTRALQALSSGACSADGYADLVNAELGPWIDQPLSVPADQAEAMLVRFRELIDRFGALADGETLELEFPTSAP